MSKLWVCRYDDGDNDGWHYIEADSAYEAAIKFCEGRQAAGRVEARELGPSFKLTIEKRVAFAMKKEGT